jgi:hypothetical protein
MALEAQFNYLPSSFSFIMGVVVGSLLSDFVIDVGSCVFEWFIATRGGNAVHRNTIGKALFSAPMAMTRMQSFTIHRGVTRIRTHCEQS